LPTADVVDELVASIEPLAKVARSGDCEAYNVRMKGREQTPARRRLLSSSAQIRSTQRPRGLPAASIGQKREPQPTASVHKNNTTDLRLIALLSATCPIVKAAAFIPEKNVRLAVHRSIGVYGVWITPR
jgi:hypothetical protein